MSKRVNCAGCSCTSHLPWYILLQGTVSEIQKKYVLLYPSNTIRQTVVRSKEINCTLHEFRCLLKSLYHKRLLSPALFPSFCTAMQERNSSIKEVNVKLANYADLCSASHVDPDTAKKGFLSRTEIETEESASYWGSGVAFTKNRSDFVTRYIAVGRGPSNGTISKRVLLLQRSPEWCERG